MCRVEKILELGYTRLVHNRQSLLRSELETSIGCSVLSEHLMKVVVFFSIKNASGKEVLIWADFTSVGKASGISTEDVVMSTSTTVTESG